MPWQSAILLGWTAMHGYFAVFCAGIWLARPRDRQALVLLGLVASMAAFISVGVLRDHASDPGEILAYAHLRAVVSALEAALFVDFVGRLLGQPQAPWVRFGYLVVLLTAALAALGVLYAPLPAVVPFGAESSPQPRPLRLVMAALAIPGPIWMAVQVTRFPSRVQGGRAFASILLVTMACAIHDLVLRFFGLPWVPLLDHSLVLVSAVLTHVLLSQIQDVSARLRRHNHALREQAEALDRTRDEIQQTAPLAAVGELASMLAQEVEAPLLAVRSGAMALAERPDATVWHTMDAAIGRLDRLVENLLGHTRPLAPVRAWVPLFEVLQEAVDGSRVVGMADAQLFLSERARAIEVCADAALLHEALCALVDALRTSHSGVQLRAECDAGLGGVSVVVTRDDTATALPSADARAPAPALGMALPYADRVLAAHGGSVESLSDGLGARVWLPGVACRAIPAGAP